MGATMLRPVYTLHLRALSDVAASLPLCTGAGDITFMSSRKHEISSSTIVRANTVSYRTLLSIELDIR